MPSSILRITRPANLEHFARAQLVKLGADPMSMTQGEFARFVRGESEAAARIAKAVGIKPQ
jgi:hypothetical protein